MKSPVFLTFQDILLFPFFVLYYNFYCNVVEIIGLIGRIGIIGQVSQLLLGTVQTASPLHFLGCFSEHGDNGESYRYPRGL